MRQNSILAVFLLGERQRAALQDRPTQEIDAQIRLALGQPKKETP